MFQEKYFFMAYWGFLENFRFPLCQGKLHQNLSDRVELFFVDTSVYTPEVILSFFKNLAFFFLYKENT